MQIQEYNVFEKDIKNIDQQAPIIDKRDYKQMVKKKHRSIRPLALGQCGLDP